MIDNILTVVALLATVTYFNTKVLAYKTALEVPRLFSLYMVITCFFSFFAVLEPTATFAIIAYLLVGEAIGKTWYALTKDLKQ
jgi:hypothetical protein